MESYITQEVAQIFATQFIYYWLYLLVPLYPLYLTRKLLFT